MKRACIERGCPEYVTRGSRLVEQAHADPRFVEDVVREVVAVRVERAARSSD